MPQNPTAPHAASGSTPDATPTRCSKPRRPRSRPPASIAERRYVATQIAIRTEAQRCLHIFCTDPEEFGEGAV